MILSASRRTDIPAFYSDWFFNRLHAGAVLVRNPMNRAQISRIPLSPELVDCIVFWTKDPRAMVGRLDELDAMGYRYYFQFTLTAYGKNLEANLRPKGEIEDSFLKLSERLGKNRVLWRYDPILFSGQIDADWHRQQFERLCEKLCRHTNSVTISFVDLYAHLCKSLIRAPKADEMAELSQMLSAAARGYGLKIKACCEKLDLSPYGIEKAGCIDQEVIEALCGGFVKIGKDKSQRVGCNCCESVDIGAYNTCRNGCAYCYANTSGTAKPVKHNPNAELLFGEVQEGEKITERKVSSNKTGQMKFF